jgi:hypothetical protein
LTPGSSMKQRFESWKLHEATHWILETPLRNASTVENSMKQGIEYWRLRHLKDPFEWILQSSWVFLIPFPSPPPFTSSTSSI